MWDPFELSESTTRPNGLTIHGCHLPERSIVVRFVCRFGTQNDPVDQEGLQHFLEHVLRHNAGFSSATELEAWFEDRGGSLMENDESSFAETGFSHISFGFTVPNDERVLADALQIFGTMLVGARLENGIELERKRVLGEFLVDFPEQRLYNLGLRKHEKVHHDSRLACFAGILGTKKAVRQISQEHLQSWYDSHFIPGNIDVVYAGGVRFNRFTKIIDMSPLGTHKKGMIIKRPEVQATLAPPIEQQHESKRRSGPAEQDDDGGKYQSVTRISGSILFPAFWIFRDLLDKALYEDLSEKEGWSYGFDIITSNLASHAELEIVAEDIRLDVLDKVVQGVDACIESIGENQDRFEKQRARAIMRMSTMDSQLSPVAITEIAKDRLVDCGRIPSFNEIVRGYGEATWEEIQSIVEHVRPERRWTLITHP